MKFTVVLFRNATEFEALAPQRDDIYVAWQLNAPDIYTAVRFAKAEVCAADNRDRPKPRHTVNDYALCVAFEGWQEPKLFGWQAHEPIKEVRRRKG
jgi:hypothetical protein